VLIGVVFIPLLTDGQWRTSADVEDEDDGEVQTTRYDISHLQSYKTNIFQDKRFRAILVLGGMHV
jgi:hypothetical protein